MNEIRDFRKSMEFMSDKYDQLLQKHNLLIEENKQMKINFAQITSTNEIMQESMNDMSIDINEIKQNKLKRKLVITGAPVINNPNELKTLYTEIITKLELSQNENKISDIFQGKHINSGTQSAPIFIELQCVDAKNTLLQISRARKLKTTDFGFNNNNKIKISERLTTHNIQLLNEANQLRSHGFKFIWVKNGKIFIRKSNNSEIINIKHISEIDSRKQQNITN